MKSLPAPNERSLLLIGGCALLLLVAFVVYVLTPQVKALQKLDKTRGFLQQATTGGPDLLKFLVDEQARLDGINKALESLLAGAEIRQLESHVMSRLQQTADIQGVELIAVQPRETVDFPGFSETRFEIEVSGSYLNIFRWIEQLQRQLKYMTVRDFIIVPESGENADTMNPVLNMKFSAAAYGSNAP